MTVRHEHLNFAPKVESETSSNLLQIRWLDGGSLLIGRPAAHAFIGREQSVASNELYKTELKMNCRRRIFIWEDNMFMVFAAPVYDKRIKFLVRDVSLSILNIYNRSAP